MIEPLARHPPLGGCDNETPMKRPAPTPLREPFASKLGEALRLFDLPLATIKPLTATGSPVYLTVNPVEYHGPHLSLHNDLWLSLGTVVALQDAWTRERSTTVPMLLANDLEMGVGPTPGPGSRATQPSELKRHVLRAVKALAELGAQRVVLMTFHGDPIHNLALEAGATWLRHQGIQAFCPFSVLMREMLVLNPWDYERAYQHIKDEPLRKMLIESLPYDLHAGFFETSLSLYVAPDSVSQDYQSLPPCPRVTPHRALRLLSRAATAARRATIAKELSFAAYGLGWHQVQPFPGYTQSPHLATEASGRVFFDALTAKMAEAMMQAFSVSTGVAKARCDAPIMGWLEPALLF